MEGGLGEIRNSPKDQSVLDLIVSRPEEDAREVMELADLHVEALELVSSPTGKELQLRGINLKVVQGGEIKPGDAVKKL